MKEAEVYLKVWDKTPFLQRKILTSEGLKFNISNQLIEEFWYAKEENDQSI